jgi:protein SCO1/2
VSWRRTLSIGAGSWLVALSVSQAADLPTDSLYQVDAKIITQQGAPARLNLYQGHPTVISMFYGDCQSYCPMLITAVQVYESHLDEASRAQLRVLLVSFDAAHDTPARLTQLARMHRADPARWTFASAREPDARRIAAILGLRYRQLPDGSFDHSQIITLTDSQGRVLASTTTLIGDPAFQARLEAAAAPDKRQPGSS